MFVKNLYFNPKTYAREPDSTNASIRFVNKNTTSKNKNQVVKQIISEKSFVAHVKSLYTTMPASHLAVLRLIIDHSNRMSELNFSYLYIANTLGISVRTVARAVDYLREQALIFTFWHERETNSFFPHKNFLNVKVRSLLGSLIPELREKTYRTSINSLDINQLTISNSNLIITPILTIKVSGIGKEQSLNIPLSYIYNCLVVSSRNIRVGVREENEIVKKEASKMTEVIRRVSGYLRLTQAGQVHLLKFPDEAIEDADKNLSGGRNMKNIKNPFYFFVRLCKEYCQMRNIPLNEEAVAYHKELLGISPSALFVDENLAISLPPAQTDQKKYKCSNGCLQDCKGGFSLEHTQRSIKRKAAPQTVQEPMPKTFCSLGCPSDCFVNGNYTSEHMRRYYDGVDYLTEKSDPNFKDYMLKIYRKAQLSKLDDSLEVPPRSLYNPPQNTSPQDMLQTPLLPEDNFLFDDEEWEEEFEF